MSPESYKRPQRNATEARVQEKDEAAARRREAELDQGLEEALARDTSCGCGMFQRHGVCWHTGYDPHRPVDEQGPGAEVGAHAGTPVPNADPKEPPLA